MAERTTDWHRAVNRTGGGEYPLILLEIDHESFSVPARVVNDTLDVTSNGVTFTACAFDITLPDDVEGQMPKARLAIDNVGGALTKPIEDSNGGEGATCRVMQVLRSAPNTIQFEATLDLRNIEIVNQRMVADLTYEDILNRPSVAVRHDPFTSPGLF